MQDVTEENVQIITEEPQTATPLPIPWLAVHEQFPYILPLHLQQVEDQLNTCHQLLASRYDPRQPPRSASARVVHMLTRCDHLTAVLNLQLSGLSSGQYAPHLLSTAGFTADTPESTAQSITQVQEQITQQATLLAQTAEQCFKPEVWAHMQQKVSLAPPYPQTKK
eukprot:2019158-Rhodomonas_salina.3